MSYNRSSSQTVGPTTFQPTNSWSYKLPTYTKVTLAIEVHTFDEMTKLAVGLNVTVGGEKSARWNAVAFSGVWIKAAISVHFVFHRARDSCELRDLFSEFFFFGGGC
jgi:hypothetical protein